MINGFAWIKTNKFLSFCFHLAGFDCTETNCAIMVWTELHLNHVYFDTFVINLVLAATKHRQGAMILASTLKGLVVQ